LRASILLTAATTAVVDVSIPAGVVSMTWTADDGGELPDGLFRDLGHSVKLPDAAGDTIYFPEVEQTSDDGEAVDVINAAADTSNPAGTSGVTWAALVLALLGLGLGGAAFAKAGTTATPGTT
jgi:hypothetical protein